MEAHYIGFKMWAQAVRQAGTTDVDAVRQAMYGQKVKAPCGFVEVMNTNHHLSKPVIIGEIQANGQFDVVWQTKEPSRPTPGAPISPKTRARSPTGPIPGSAAIAPRPNTPIEARRSALCPHPPRCARTPSPAVRERGHDAFTAKLLSRTAGEGGPSPKVLVGEGGTIPQGKS